MATPFRLKRSAVSNKRPALADLELGELAFNFYDGHLFAERDTGGVGIGTTVALLTPWIEIMVEDLLDILVLLLQQLIMVIRSLELLLWEISDQEQWHHQL